MATYQFPDPRREQFLERPLPSSEESERLLLGAVLLDNDVFNRLLVSLAPEDFYGPLHRRVYKAMMTLNENKQKIDPILIAEELKKDGSVDAFGGVATITNLTYGMPFYTVDDLDIYIGIVRDKKTARDLVRACNEITNASLEEEESAEGLLALAEFRILEIRHRLREESALKTYEQVSDETLHELNLWRKGETSAIPTGIPEFDRKLHARGLARGELYYFAAMTSVGKTALVLQLIDNMESRGMRSLTFSLEMTAVRLLLRSIQRRTNGLEFSPYTMREITEPRDEKQERRQRYGDYAYQRACEVLKQIAQWRGLVDDTTRSWAQIKARIRRAHAQKPLDCIAGDYIQLVNLQGRRRDEELATISRESQEIAKELKVPFLWISQFSRKGKAGERPEMDWMKESSQLEQDADFVGLLYGTDDNRTLFCPKQRNGMSDWEIGMTFNKTQQMMLTPELAAMLNQQPLTEDEKFLHDFNADRAGAPVLVTQQATPPPAHVEQKTTTTVKPAALADDDIDF